MQVYSVHWTRKDGKNIDEFHCALCPTVVLTGSDIEQHLKTHVADAFFSTYEAQEMAVPNGNV